MVLLRGFTVSDAALPPHFLFGNPSTGFPGISFLQVGLAAGVAHAQRVAEQHLVAQLTSASNAAYRVSGTRTNPRAGISLKVFENIYALRRVDVKRSLSIGFRAAEAVAKAAADTHFKTHSGPTRPLLPSGERAPTVDSFRYRFFKSGNDVVGLAVQTLGSDEDISKVAALNFGLRRAREGETPSRGRRSFTE